MEFFIFSIFGIICLGFLTLLVLTIINLVWTSKLSQKIKLIENPEYANQVKTAPVKERPVVQQKKPEAKIKTSDKESLESRIGSGCLPKIGMTAIIIGMGFFLKYAIDNQWLGEVARVLIGLFVGLAALITGEWMHRKKYSKTGLSITGGGIAILYFSIYAAYAFYHLIGNAPAFGFMILVTIVDVLISVRYNSKTIAVLGLLSAFLTPVMLSTGKNQLAGLSYYMILLDLGFLLLAHFKDWKFLNLLAFLCTISLFVGWADKFYTTKQFLPAMGFLTVFFIIFSALSIYYNLIHKIKITLSGLGLLTANSLAYFCIGAHFVDKWNDDFTGLFTLFIAALYIVIAIIVNKQNKDDRKLINFNTGLALFFMTLVFPMQFDGNPVTFSWIVESLILMSLGFYLKSSKIRISSILVLIISAFRLLFYTQGLKYIDGEYTFNLIFNPRFGLFVLFIAVCYIIVYLYNRTQIKTPEQKSNIIKAGLIIAASVFTIIIFMNEISDYFRYKQYSLPEHKSISIINKKLNDIHSKINKLRFESKKKNITAEFKDTTDRKIDELKMEQTNLHKERSDLYEKMSPTKHNLRHAKNLTLSIVLGLYSLLLIIAGIGLRVSLFRLIGIFVLSIVIIKVFLYDSAELRTIYRILSFIGLGSILLFISILYTRYKKKINDFILSDKQEDNTANE